MFTGIVEKTGKISSITHSGGAARVKVEAKGFWNDVSLGDSIAIDGVCLTIVEQDETSASFDVSDETLKRSIMGGYKTGSLVNLEKALLPTQRLGGHFVQGHVDGMGEFKGSKKSGDNVELSFDIPKELTKYVVEKGSITINGVSLTAFDLQGNSMKIAVIPHTLEITSLSELKPGSGVNIEADVIAKHIEKLLLSDEEKGLNRELLKEKGFL